MFKQNVLHLGPHGQRSLTLTWSCFQVGPRSVLGRVHFLSRTQLDTGPVRCFSGAQANSVGFRPRGEEEELEGGPEAGSSWEGWSQQPGLRDPNPPPPAGEATGRGLSRYPCAPCSWRCQASPRGPLLTLDLFKDELGHMKHFKGSFEQPRRGVGVLPGRSSGAFLGTDRSEQDPAKAAASSPLGCLVLQP